MAKALVDDMTYHIEDKIKEKWDRIKDGKLAKIDEDRVYVVDGREGCGKSLFTIQQAAYIDPTIIEIDKEKEVLKDLPRITFTPEETLEAIRTTKSTNEQTKCIIFDEAFRGLSSRSVLARTNKLIVQALMEMRQNNLVLFIVLPSFFMLDMYAAVSRSSALFHVIKSKKGRRRSFLVFNYAKKAVLYNLGIKKGWGYNTNTRTRGKFFGKYPGGQAFEDRYREKKLKALQESNKDLSGQEKLDRNIELKHRMIYAMMKNQNFNYVQGQEWLRSQGIDVSRELIRRVMNKYEENAPISS